jgi:hypothetical protein
VLFDECVIGIVAIQYLLGELDVSRVPRFGGPNLLPTLLDPRECVRLTTVAMQDHATDFCFEVARTPLRRNQLLDLRFQLIGVNVPNLAARFVKPLGSVRIHSGLWTPMRVLTPAILRRRESATVVLATTPSTNWSERRRLPLLAALR